MHQNRVGGGGRIVSKYVACCTWELVVGVCECCTWELVVGLLTGAEVFSRNLSLCFIQNLLKTSWAVGGR